MREWLNKHHPFLFLTKLIFYWPFEALYFFGWVVPVAIYKGIWYSLVYIMTFGYIVDGYKWYKGTATKQEKIYVGLALAFFALGLLSWMVDG
tara:strand:+ start:170 stop:445 length:276 start_codon:yes stop_codon:yes gene_type:complete